ncbi:hypothetical protein RintRC_1688 [Richelia intracellularis]|nr:hypothetical protein RintRC_1688 [Richelia intracellularis]
MRSHLRNLGFNTFGSENLTFSVTAEGKFNHYYLNYSTA